MFVNANADAYLGYSGWATGAFSPTTYNLAETPIGSAGNFTNQPIVTQCIVRIHIAGGIASKREAIYRARMVRRAV
jgi:endoglucanase